MPVDSATLRVRTREVSDSAPLGSRSNPITIHYDDYDSGTHGLPPLRDPDFDTKSPGFWEGMANSVHTDSLSGKETSQSGNRSSSYEWFTSKTASLFCSDISKAQQTLHQIRNFYDQVNPDLRDDLDIFFQSDWVRKSALKHWGLFIDCDNVNQDVLQSEHEYPDVASWSAHDSLDNLEFLFRQGIILPCYYNSFGHSFFFLAFQKNAVQTIRYILSTMSPIQLLAPASLAQNSDARTIIQLATAYSDVFSICWEKVEEMPLDFREVLQLKEIRNICRFASTDLAGRMYVKDIDLAEAVESDPFLWLEIIQYHPHPASFFGWLSDNKCWPPQDFLRAFAYHYGSREAEHWLLFANKITETSSEPCDGSCELPARSEE